MTAPPRRIATVAATGYKAFLYTLEGQPDDKKQSIEKDYMAPIVDDPAAHALRILTGDIWLHKQVMTKLAENGVESPTS